ncbi:MAG TPA: GIY-YIG nuclease family protein [Bacteroidia bacterium]|nr:GIY-YIG nuclease family protein [Bacteroidia bacterium]
MSYVVYILYSESSNRTYVGQTSDLEKRLVYHNEISIGSFTSKFRPWKLIHSEKFDSRSEAMRREKWFKSGVGRDEIQKIKNRCGVESAAADSSSGS